MRSCELCERTFDGNNYDFIRPRDGERMKVCGACSVGGEVRARLGDLELVIDRDDLASADIEELGYVIDEMSSRCEDLGLHLAGLRFRR